MVVVDLHILYSVHYYLQSRHLTHCYPEYRHLQIQLIGALVYRHGSLLSPTSSFRSNDIDQPSLAAPL